MVRAIGQAGERLAAAKEEFRTGGIADRPVTGRLAQFQQRQALAHRHHIVVGDRVRFDLDFESVGERGIAARHRARYPHHVLGRAGLPLARCRRGGALGAAGKPEPVYFADHGVSRHISELRGDLAGRKAGLPEFLQLLDALVGPGQYRHRMSSLSVAPAVNRQRSDLQSPKSLWSESLSPRRARLTRRNVYAEHWGLRGSELPHEMSYPTAETLQYGGTRAQESASVLHMFRHLGIAIGFLHRSGGGGDSLPAGRGRTASRQVDTHRRGPRMPRRAAPKRRHVLFSVGRLLLHRAKARTATGPNPQ